MPPDLNQEFTCSCFTNTTRETTLNSSVRVHDDMVLYPFQAEMGQQRDEGKDIVFQTDPFQVSSRWESGTNLVHLE